MSAVAQSRARRSIAVDIPPEECTPRVREAVSMLTMQLHELRRQMDEMERSSELDYFLPVLNRRAFMRDLAREISAIKRYGSIASLVFADLDGFKTINDTFGHACGDAALEHVAGLLLHNVRDSDAVGRLGGDEFAILLTRATADEARCRMSAIVEILRARPFSWQGLSIPLSFSFGVHGLTGDMDSAAALARADAGMYARKRNAAQATLTEPANM